MENLKKNTYFQFLDLYLSRVTILVFIFSLFLFSDCHTNSPKNQNSIVGYKLIVDYPDRKEVYILPIENIVGNELSDILAGYSLQQDPSIRFVSTSQSIEVMDVLGTRNNFQYAWRLYVDYKEVSPSDLKKSKPVQLNQIIQLKYLPLRKDILP